MALIIDDIKLNRDDLADFLPNPRSIKAFENLQRAIRETIPDAVNGNTDAIDALQAISDGSLATAGIAQSLAAAALSLAQDLAAQAQQIEQLRATLMALQSDINDLASQASQAEQLRSLVTTIQSDINDLKQGYLA